MRPADEIVAELWAAKRTEAEAKERRVALEADLAQAIGLPEDWEGSRTRKIGPFKVKLQRKMNVRIDAEELRRVAREGGLTEALEACFRWRPELDKRAWDEADEAVRVQFARAMEVTPGKPCFTVTPAEATA